MCLFFQRLECINWHILLSRVDLQFFILTEVIVSRQNVLFILPGMTGRSLDLIWLRWFECVLRQMMDAGSSAQSDDLTDPATSTPVRQSLKLRHIALYIFISKIYQVLKTFHSTIVLSWLPNKVANIFLRELLLLVMCATLPNVPSSSSINLQTSNCIHFWKESNVSLIYKP